MMVSIISIAIFLIVLIALKGSLQSTFHPEVSINFEKLYTEYKKELETYCNSRHIRLMEKMPYKHMLMIYYDTDEIIKLREEIKDFSKIKRLQKNYPYGFIIICHEILHGIIKDKNHDIPGMNFTEFHSHKRNKYPYINFQKFESNPYQIAESTDDLDYDDVKLLLKEEKRFSIEDKKIRKRIEAQELEKKFIKEILKNSKRKRYYKDFLINNNHGEDDKTYLLENLNRLDQYINYDERIKTDFSHEILEVETRKKYYKTFLKEEGRTQNDKEFILRKLNALDKYIENQLKEELHFLEKEHPAGLRAYYLKYGKDPLQAVENQKAILELDTPDEQWKMKEAERKKKELEFHLHCYKLNHEGLSRKLELYCYDITLPSGKKVRRGDTAISFSVNCFTTCTDKKYIKHNQHLAKSREDNYYAYIGRILEFIQLAKDFPSECFVVLSRPIDYVKDVSEKCESFFAELSSRLDERNIKHCHINEITTREIPFGCHLIVVDYQTSTHVLRLNLGRILEHYFKQMPLISSFILCHELNEKEMEAFLTLEEISSKHEERKKVKEVSYSDLIPSRLTTSSTETRNPFHLTSLQKAQTREEFMASRMEEIERIKNKYIHPSLPGLFQTSQPQPSVTEPSQPQHHEVVIKRATTETLKSCVQSWKTLDGSLKYSYFVKYLPTTSHIPASSVEWDNRYLVWNFKNDPEKTSSTNHERALNTILRKMEEKLTKTFGSENLSELTLVCIPASTQRKNEARYKDFMERLCNKTGMTDSYEQIKVIRDRQAKHEGGYSMDTDNLSINQTFFKNRNILLFDDIITFGNSMLSFQNTMQNLGAHVICGIAIGLTEHYD